MGRAVHKILGVTYRLLVALNTNSDITVSQLLKECNAATVNLEQSIKQMKESDGTGEVPSLLKVDVWSCMVLLICQSILIVLCLQCTIIMQSDY